MKGVKGVFILEKDKPINKKVNKFFKDNIDLNGFFIRKHDKSYRLEIKIELLKGKEKVE